MVDQRPIEKPPAEPVALTGVEDRPMSGGPAPGGLEQDLPEQARVIAPSLLQSGEIIVFQLKPSRWYMVFESLWIAAIGLILVLMGLSIHELPASVRSWAIVVGISVIGLRATVAYLQWLGRTYVLTDRRILMQYGVLSAEVECMGLEEIQNTFVAQAAAQRLLGIGSLFFRCRHETHRGSMVWEHIREPKEIHARIILQIDRWKRTLEMMKRQ
jgi:membrane protein YdbS with pleckstrin-like domain